MTPTEALANVAGRDARYRQFADATQSKDGSQLKMTERPVIAAPPLCKYVGSDVNGHEYRTGDWRQCDHPERAELGIPLAVRPCGACNTKCVGYVAEESV